MHLTRANFTVLVAVAAGFLTAAAGPVEKKADSTSSAISSFPTATLVGITLSSSATTVGFALPAATTAAPDSGIAASKNESSKANFTSLDSSLTPIQNFPACNDAAAKPFCLPANNTDVYLGEAYNVTWNPRYFKPNSTINILLNWSDGSNKNVWSSGLISSESGGVLVDVKQDWLQNLAENNLTFFAQDYSAAGPPVLHNGPVVQLKEKPQMDYHPPASGKVPEEAGLKIGVPVCLGAVAVVAAGLFFTMRRQRRNRLGSRGYGIRKSRGQRLGRARSKEEDVMLQERELLRSDEYTDDPPPPARSLSNDSLEHLVPAPIEEGGNSFREEIERQNQARR